MSESDGLHEKITEEIKKTGFPTELASAEIMRNRGWGVIHNPSYLDHSEQKSREFDIRAFRQTSFQTSSGGTSVGYYLISECKKSEKPWVFFVSPEDHHLSTITDPIKWHTSYQGKKSDPVQAKFMSPKEILNFHHYYKNKERARTFFEPFTQNSGKTIYGSIMTCVKATLAHYQGRPFSNMVSVYCPLIIFEGRLFKAYVGSEIYLEETNYLQLDFRYILPSYNLSKSGLGEETHKFVIDIVRNDFLSNYLEIMELELQNISRVYESAVSSYSAKLD